MPRTKADQQTIVSRARRSRAARRRLLEKAVEQLNGQPRMALQTMGYYVEATCGFKGLAKQTGTRRGRLVRMLSAAGRPRLRNFMRVFMPLLRQEGYGLAVEHVRK